MNKESSHTRSTILPPGSKDWPIFKPDSRPMGSDLAEGQKGHTCDSGVQLHPDGTKNLRLDAAYWLPERTIKGYEELLALGVLAERNTPTSKDLTQDFLTLDSDDFMVLCEGLAKQGFRRWLKLLLPNQPDDKNRNLLRNLKALLEDGYLDSVTIVAPPDKQAIEPNAFASGILRIDPGANYY